MTDVRQTTFVFPAIERLICGESTARILPKEADRLGAKRVFLMVSGTMSRTTDEIEKVKRGLGDRYAGVFDGIAPFTPRGAVLEAAQLARDARADLIVTFGGGSVVEAGKIVRLCLQHNIVDMDGFEPFRIVVDADGTRKAPQYEGPAIAQIAVPTTLSAGEFHAGGGATDERIKVKQSYANPKMVPRVIVFDPAPTVHTPMWVWLSTGVRALDHSVEGLCSQFGGSISDHIYKQALALLAGALRKVKRDPLDLDARLDCQMGTWLAMSGRHGGVEMGASHAIGHVLGGTCGVPHGYTSCVMLPHVLRYNREVNLARQRMVAEAMGHPGEDAADVVAAFIEELGMPRRLADVGIRRDQFALIAATAMHDRWLHTNPVKIASAEKVLRILEAAA